jgi:hypothetical protein
LSSELDEIARTWSLRRCPSQIFADREGLGPCAVHRDGDAPALKLGQVLCLDQDQLGRRDRRFDARNIRG